MYNNCYNNYYDKFDWLIFNDIDEYLYLKNYFNIKDFLIQSKFNNCEKIQLNWILYTDNNLIFYKNRPLQKRFTEIESIGNNNKYRNIFSNGKSILRGHIGNINITNFHCLSKNLNSCDGFGNIIKSNFIKFDFKYHYFKHYYCKSLEEFVEKIKKGDVYKGTINSKLIRYFKYNKITSYKIDYYKKY